jgi:hypothetical protein
VVAYYGAYSTLRDRVRIDSLNARWSFDGTALRLVDMTGGSCSDAVIWTTNPWTLRSGAIRDASVVPDGTYEAGLTDADRLLCDSKPGGRGLGPPSGPRGNPTLYTSITFDAGALRGSEREGSLTAIPNVGWVGSYRLYGSTFELTKLTSLDGYMSGPEHWDLLTARFTFDGTTLTLKPLGSWPCWASVWWTLHPWTLPKKTP